VNHILAVTDVRPKGNAFDLSGNLIRSDSVIAKHANDIQEEGLADGVGSSGGAIHVHDVHSVGEIDFENLFHHSVAVIPTSMPVALVNQEFMIVKSENFAHAGAGG